jgi:hypothetical protein
MNESLRQIACKSCAQASQAFASEACLLARLLRTTTSSTPYRLLLPLSFLLPSATAAPKQNRFSRFSRRFSGFITRVFEKENLWCSHTVHHPQGELAKFGYRLEMKVENLKNPAIFWPPLRTYCLKTIVPFQVRHKLNNFLICWIFWILIVSYDENLKDSCSQQLIPEPLVVDLSNKLLTINQI